MTGQDLYVSIGFQTAKLVTEEYSTSFSAAVTLIKQPKREAIYAIYGYTRLADELVDTWRPKDMSKILDDFEAETFRAIRLGYSLNPVIHAFSLTVNRYSLDHKLIKAFLASMRMDIKKTRYSKSDYQRYIYGSAEVIGLMCLVVFCNGKKRQVARLTAPASSLGSAFQKVNFLRDLSADHLDLGRMYFPGMDVGKLSNQQKTGIITEIESEYALASKAIKQLPPDCRWAVWLATHYYIALTRKLARTDVAILKSQRVRVSNAYKAYLFVLARGAQIVGW